MAAIEHASRINTTNQTTTNNGWIDTTNRDISSASFTTGDKYLILAAAQISNSSTSASAAVRIAHGATPFLESICRFIPGTGSQRGPYFWHTVWTAVSGEEIKFQFIGSASGNTVSLNFLQLIAINLSHDVVENTDWFFAERVTDDSLTTTMLDGAVITFTPQVASHDWLVIQSPRFTMSVVTVSAITRMQRSGEAASTLPEARTESASIISQLFSLARVFTLGASSNTFTEQAAESASDVTRVYSSIFAIDLNKFRNHGFAYTEADVSLSATDYATQLQTLGFTPDVTGDVWVGSYFGFDANNASRILEYRLQQDNVDVPAGQTTANYQFDAGTDVTDELPVLTHALPSLTGATAYTFDVDGSADSTTGTPTAQHRSLWAVSMELPGAAGLAVPVFTRQYRQRWG